MISKVKSIIAAALASVILAVPLLAPAAVYAADPQNNTVGSACSGVNLDASNLNSTTPGTFADCHDPHDTNGNGLTNLIKLVINIFSLIVGVVAVIMIIIGGLKYITSGGESGNVQGAKNTILYAVIGLIVVALAQFIVRYVLSRVGDTVG